MFSARQCQLCNIVNITTKTEPLDLNDPNLIQCKCKMIQYCGPKHQAEDVEHKEFCDAMDTIVKCFDADHPLEILMKPTNLTTLEDSSRVLILAAERVLKRKLHIRETRLINHPVYCRVCVQFNAKVTCSKCGVASYCTKRHMEEDRASHVLVCDELALYACRFKYLFMVPPQINYVFNKTIEKLNTMNIFTLFEELTGYAVTSNPAKSADSYNYFTALASFSRIATICFALRNFTMPVTKSKTFRILIYNFRPDDEFYFKEEHLKFFFMQYPIYDHLVLYLVGYELTDCVNHSTKYHYNGRLRTMNTYVCPGSYIDFCAMDHPLPGLIVCFNNCFSSFRRLCEAETEDESLLEKQHEENTMRLLLTKETPIILTSSDNEEAIIDIQELVYLSRRIKQQNIKLVCCVPSTENPFYDPRPIFNMNMTKSFYQGKIIHVVTTKLAA